MRGLLGDRVTDVTSTRQSVAVDHFGEPPEAFRDYVKANYGPTIVVYRSVADDPDKVEALERHLADLARRYIRERGRHGDGLGESLLLTARKAA